MMKDSIINPEKALHRIQALCARHEKCSHDIRLKLRQWKLSNTDIEKIIKSLTADAFLNDERFAKMFVRDKSKFNKWGPIKITYALKSKHFSDDIISSALAEIDHSKDQSSLKELLERKIRGVKSKSTYDLKTKLIRFGISRGFDYDSVSKAVSSLIMDT